MYYLFYAKAAVVTNRLGMKKKSSKKTGVEEEIGEQN